MNVAKKRQGILETGSEGKYEAMSKGMVLLNVDTEVEERLVLICYLQRKPNHTRRRKRK